MAQGAEEVKELCIGRYTVDEAKSTRHTVRCQRIEAEPEYYAREFSEILALHYAVISQTCSRAMTSAESTVQLSVNHAYQRIR